MRTHLSKPRSLGQSRTSESKAVPVLTNIIK